MRGGVAPESHEVVLVVVAAEEEGDLDGARPLWRALHGAPHPERQVDGHGAGLEEAARVQRRVGERRLRSQRWMRRRRGRSFR